MWNSNFNNEFVYYAKVEMLELFVHKVLNKSDFINIYLEHKNNSF